MGVDQDGRPFGGRWSTLVLGLLVGIFCLVILAYSWPVSSTASRGM
jgi:hypothetical protein